MSGLQEILVVAVIVICIFFIPRMMPGRLETDSRSTGIRLSKKMRLAIAASLVYPVAAAAVFRPWQVDPVPFAYLGIGPVALGWLLYWVFSGHRRR